jgi:predicted glycosyltransferase
MTGTVSCARWTAARLLMDAHDTYGLGHLRRITDLLSSHPRLRQRVSA